MWLRMAYLAFHRRVNSWMLAYGITADQYVVLRVVANEPGITQIDIVERTASDPNTVAAVLGLLERRNLIRRKSHARDGRMRCVFLTAAGIRLQQRIAKDSEGLRAMLRNCVAKDDSEQYGRFLQKVHEVFSTPPVGRNGRPNRQSPKRKPTK